MSVWKDSLGCTGPERDRRNRRRVDAWALAWALSFVAVTFAITRDGLPAAWIRIALIAVTVALAVVTLLAYRHYLREADELRRRIELEALALAFGVGVIGGVTYWLLELAGIVAEARLLDVVTAMMLTHPLGILLGNRRYR